MIRGETPLPLLEDMGAPPREAQQSPVHLLSVTVIGSKTGLWEARAAVHSWSRVAPKHYWLAGGQWLSPTLGDMVNALTVGAGELSLRYSEERAII